MNNNTLFDEQLFDDARLELENFLNELVKMCAIEGKVNPIVGCKTRRKKINSIIDKLIKKGYQFINLNNNDRKVGDLLFDIVAGRIVCSFVGDIDFIVANINKLVEESDGKIKILTIKNYIENPKDSGYSSLHMILEFNINGKKVNMEIQIRTVAMDWAASVDHKLRYKKNKNSEDLENYIKSVFEFCRYLDYDMDKSVRDFVYNKEDVLSSDYPFMNEDEYKKFKLNCNCALDSIDKLFSQIYKEFDENGITNSIEHKIKVIKSEDRVIKKLKNKGKEVSIENIKKCINDFASFKVVCTFLSELEELKYYIEELLINNGIKIVETNDYIKESKNNGYRGFHYLIEVPIYDLNGNIVSYEKVVIQLWTIAMQMWANFEDELVYYSNESDEKIIEELHRVANITNTIDNYCDKKYKENLKEIKKELVKVKKLEDN